MWVAKVVVFFNFVSMKFTRLGFFVFLFPLLFPLLFLVVLSAQPPKGYWQQEVDYRMLVSLDTEKHLLKGSQTLTYTNHSPDTLRRVFYHLYFNAFQPGSMMDVRSRSLPDADARVADRISKLKEDEIGYQKVLSLTQEGMALSYVVKGTILEVPLARRLEPGKSTVLDMRFEAQVPVQIRRSGRDNKEGIRYSMTQWYPKMAEYDVSGWHATPYVGREFYGVWGNFDVRIEIDEAFVIGGTGVLQNAEEIGHGYASGERKKNEGFSKGKLVWHFKADRVHDFAWAADPDYVHKTVQVPNGPELHFLYQETRKTKKAWSRLADDIRRAFPYIERNFGEYPYEVYSFIQGGDGGMEYPMATLITADRRYNSLLGVAMHELMHSWYHGVLATNESWHAWMDEGFTSYAEKKILHDVFRDRERKLPKGKFAHPFLLFYYAYQTSLEQEERMNTWADHFQTNGAYGVASYAKGALFLQQLGYIIGEEALRRVLLRYYDTWKFKHPAPTDFMRIAERVSGMELDWYYEYFVNTTAQIDYAIKEVVHMEASDSTKVVVWRKGRMPMPLEVEVKLKDDKVLNYYIPLRMMYGEKPLPDTYTRLPAAVWTDTTYEWVLPARKEDIERIEIDPDLLVADVDLKNGIYPPPDGDGEEGGK